MKGGPLNGATDRDQVHVLPLDIIPLEAKALQKTWMLKNSHPETVLELYRDSSAGSGQIEIGQLRTVFKEVGMSDISVLQKLSRLHSYDLYSLRRLLHIEVYEVPDFLSDMGDLFMSISYYKEYMDRIGPIFVYFNASVEEITDNRQLQQDKSLIQNCEMVQHQMKSLAANVIKRFRAFETINKDMQNSVCSDNFNLVGKTISGSQTEMGGALCTLTVKMMAWSQRFPHRHTGGPNKWADFMLTDMRQGLEKNKR